MEKIAVVTGASKGIGLAIVKRLCLEGYRVFGISRSESLIKNDKLTFIKFDLEDFAKMDELVNQLPEKIDVLVNDAGKWFEKKVEDITLEDIESTFRLNYYAPVLLTAKLLSHMNKDGVIINIASVMAIISDAGYSLYCSSKSALDRYTTTLAKERTELKIIGILPSGTDTPGMRAAQDDMSGMLKPEQVASVVWDAVSGKFSSGSLISVINNRSREWWASRDTYNQIVDVDKGK